MFPWLKKLRTAYQDGPDWIKIPDLRIRGKYRPVTLLVISWVYAWYIRAFSIPGRMVIIIAPLIIGYTLLAVRTPVRMLAFTVIALLFTDFFVGMIFRPKLRIKRSAPERARCGSEFRLEYIVSNKRFFPALDLVMDCHLREKGLKFHSGPAAVNLIQGKSSIRLTATASAETRGLYTLHKPIVDSSFPLGLIKWSCSDAYLQKLHVYPAFHSIYELKLPVGRRFQKEGSSRVAKVGESLDFAGCRDFRAGDDPRHIHWAGLARSGKLTVKEYQEEYLSRVAVIVDTSVKKTRFDLKSLSGMKKQYKELEAAISISAALAEFLAKGDYVIDFFAAGPEVYHFQGGRSLSCLDHILDILACIEPGHQTLDSIYSLVADEIRSIGSVVVILIDWDEERKTFIDKLAKHGVAIKTLLVSDNDPGGIMLDNFTRLSPEDVNNGGVRRL
ncbi:MAG: DUF58 domain-containing protein [Victivallales bacterium]|nr:DUF58 domain-containing protein [Victivallales bacterium]